MVNPVYRDKRWPICRRQTLVRDGFRCQIRLAGCLVKANAADHIVELEDGGAPFDLANLQAACKPCNTAKRNMAIARRSKGVTDGYETSRSW